MDYLKNLKSVLLKHFFLNKITALDSITLFVLQDSVSGSMFIYYLLYW